MRVRGKPEAGSEVVDVEVDADEAADVVCEAGGGAGRVVDVGCGGGCGGCGGGAQEVEEAEAVVRDLPGVGVGGREGFGLVGRRGTKVCSGRSLVPPEGVEGGPEGR